MSTFRTRSKRKRRTSRGRRRPLLPAACLGNPVPARRRPSRNRVREEQVILGEVAAQSPSASRSPAAGAAAAFEDIDEDEEVGTKKSNRRKTGGDRSLPSGWTPQGDRRRVLAPIDPIFFQIGLVALLIVAVVGTVTWYVRSMKTDNIDDQGNPGGRSSAEGAGMPLPRPPRSSRARLAPMPEPERVVEPRRLRTSD